MAVATNEHRLSLPLAGMSLELGGASGKIIFSRHPAHEDTTIYSEAAGYIDAMWAAGDEGVRAQIQGLWASRKRAKHQAIGWIAAGIMTLVIAFYSVGFISEAIVDLIPYSADEAVGEMARDHMGPAQLGGTVIEAPEAERAIRVIVDALDDHLSLEGEEVTFDIRIVRSDMVNAFALPGGYITVLTGLIEKSTSYEELASVLSHEIAHVTMRHGLTRIVESVGIIGGLQLIFGDVGGLVGAAEELFTMAAINGYSRSHESEADEEGVRMMHAAGIDPSASARFFQMLKDEEPGSDLPDALAWVSTHPAHDDRIDAIAEQIELLGPVRERRLDIDWQKVQESLRQPTPEEKSETEQPSPVTGEEEHDER